jgi:hypothetical protein
MPDRDENRSDAALLEALVAACVHRGEALDHGHIATANQCPSAHKKSRNQQVCERRGTGHES